MVGLTNTFTCSMLMYLGALVGMNYLFYTAFGYIITIFLSFFMNLFFTFQVRGDLMKRLGIFLLINLTNLAMVEVIEFQLIEKYHLQAVIAVFFGMSWYVVTGYLLNNFLVYRKAKAHLPA